MKTQVYGYSFMDKVLSENEAVGVLRIQREFLESYLISKDKMSVEKWLTQELQKQMPECMDEEIKNMGTDIIGSLRTTENEKVLLQKAIASGRSKESWLAARLLQSASQMSVVESASYFQEMSMAVSGANKVMANIIMKKAINNNSSSIESSLIQDNVEGRQEKGWEEIHTETDWNNYVAKDRALSISEQVGYASLQGAAVGAGLDIASKIWNEEPLDHAEIIEEAIVSGADFGIKTATAGALKVASEKGVLKVIPKGTAGDTFANIAFHGSESVRAMDKVATGEMTAKEGIDAIQQAMFASVAGIAASAKGVEVGTAIGSVMGPVGTAIGGFVGGTIGYMSGSKLGHAVVKGAQKVRDTAGRVVKSVIHSMRLSASNVISMAERLFTV